MSINRGMTRIIRVFLWLLVFAAVITLFHRRGTNDQPMIETAYTYKIAAVYPHDSSAFTQGLVYHNGYLYEGTGLYGQSSLRQVRLADGLIRQVVTLPDQYFGEGIAIVDQRIIQLTWKENTGFVYDLETFTLLGTFAYPTEGWGLAYDGELLIMSDGSSTLTFLDPHTFEPVRQVTVESVAGPVKNLNELEYINGVIYANIWLTDEIAIIDPETGFILGWINLSGLRAYLGERFGPQIHQQIDVLNGIAYQPETGCLLVTGKLWPLIFAIEVGERPLNLEGRSQGL
ncbi:MAG: glutaminyl-peptide cyclotransferase [Limnochordia bacterium]|nr:glutaminyl-peptide cyclotransferase [Bacillota bacterium]HOB09251.1 glutaminyl-peptide cyclotransferase [Limnochordia bacterium]HPT93639.1 glutaminyl-peptide cyclotransferase [Limnochordia bacterium]HPZ31406.1 glutaminyl-peptide cyclotransferase [Limnochordia bacterium]HQD71123.1 glutaminyl-peptide cyclotransferase [Limnochordia bacterium]